MRTDYSVPPASRRHQGEAAQGKKSAARQIKELCVMAALIFGGLGCLAWGLNMARSTGAFAFFPGGLIAAAGAVMVAAALWYHYRTDFRKKGGRAYARYIALAVVNGFFAMLLARYLFR